MRVVASESTSAFLPIDVAKRRVPPNTFLPRPQEFYESFEDRAVCYDCFWDAKGERVLIVAPPPLNLESDYRQAIFATDRAFDSLHCSSAYPSRSTFIYEIAGVPHSATTLYMGIAGEVLELPIRANESTAFAGRRILVTMNKDNELDWIRGWAHWHVARHGADAIILFDNGSSKYTVSEIEAALGAVSGLQTIAVIGWPYRYGRKDPGVLHHPHYPHFLQVSSLSVALRRFAMLGQGLLNCDIDELVGTGGQGSAFDQVQNAPKGIIRLAGRWVEPLTEQTAVKVAIPHLTYRHTSRNPLQSICADKWILDPKRQWLNDLTPKPSVHRIYDVPRSFARSAPTLPFWHFKAINTNWKEPRTSAGRAGFGLKRLNELDAEIDRFRDRAAGRSAQITRAS